MIILVNFIILLHSFSSVASKSFSPKLHCVTNSWGRHSHPPLTSLAVGAEYSGKLFWGLIPTLGGGNAAVGKLCEMFKLYEIQTSWKHDGLIVSSHDPTVQLVMLHPVSLHTHIQQRRRTYTIAELVPVIRVLICTSLEGLRSTSPTPPPLLKPWLSTVTIHISRESHVRSMSRSSLPTFTNSEERRDSFNLDLIHLDWEAFCISLQTFRNS